MGGPYLLQSTMRVIELTRGRVAIVDDEDFLELAQYSWCCNAAGYAVRRKKFPDGAVKVVYMHREIMGTHPNRLVVDHINGEKCDNRRENLRWATLAQNAYNHRIHKTNSSGIRGVRYLERAKSYVARISVNNKTVHLGYFKTAEEARLAYNTAVLKLRGDFANIN